MPRMLFVLVLLAGTAEAGDVATARQEQLMHLLRHDCGSCHGLTMKGGLGPPLTVHDLADKDSDMLAKTIIFGRRGTPMPPWGHEISDTEALWLIDRLKQGAIHGP